MIFTTNKASSIEPHVFLMSDNWDDWFRYNTLYHLYFFDGQSFEYNLIGSIKIGEIEMTSKRPKIPSEFEHLPSSHFSVGQDVTYYENISKLSDQIRLEIHSSLNDIAFREELYQQAIDYEVTRSSLLRFVTTTSVRGQFRRLAQGNAKLTKYKFSYTTNYGDGQKLDFKVIPESNPPTNVHVFIGRNGVGKTYLLENMISALLEPQDNNQGQFSSSEKDQPFANLVSVNFSAFDNTRPPKQELSVWGSIPYHYIGLKHLARTKNSGQEYLITKSNQQLIQEFVKSLERCKRSSKIVRWKEALFELESDQLFKRKNISGIGDIKETKDLIRSAVNTFRNLSSGHKIVLLTITRLVETIQEKSLLILDEPETHLHPPLLSAFIRALSNLLISTNGVAILATHSPVVLQEVPRSCVTKIRRSGDQVEYDKLPIETFGENVGILTREVFGLEVTHSGFHKLISEIADRSQTYEEIVEVFNGELGLEAKSLARTIVSNR